MNKQELIKKLKELLTTPSEIEGYDFDFDDGYDFGIERAITLAEQLDEPEKPVVPKYVADWIDWCKKNNITFLGACTAIFNNKNIRTLDASGWATKNQKTCATAWFYGYEVEKEKLYFASFRDTNQYLGWNEQRGEWFMSCSPFMSGVKQTQETWEKKKKKNNQAFEMKDLEECNQKHYAFD